MADPLDPAGQRLSEPDEDVPESDVPDWDDPDWDDPDDPAGRRSSEPAEDVPESDVPDWDAPDVADPLDPAGRRSSEPDRTFRNRMCPIGTIPIEMNLMTRPVDGPPNRMRTCLIRLTPTGKIPM